MPCDQCQVLSINGVACHETGCPNSWLHPVTGVAYTVQCRECDRYFKPKSRLQKLCPPCARIAQLQ